MAEQLSSNNFVLDPPTTYSNASNRTQTSGEEEPARSTSDVTTDVPDAISQSFTTATAPTAASSTALVLPEPMGDSSRPSQTLGPMDPLVAVGANLTHSSVSAPKPMVRDLFVTDCMCFFQLFGQKVRHTPSQEQALFRNYLDIVNNIHTHGFRVTICVISDYVSSLVTTAIIILETYFVGDVF